MSATVQPKEQASVEQLESRIVQVIRARFQSPQFFRAPGVHPLTERILLELEIQSGHNLCDIWSG